MSSSKEKYKKYFKTIHLTEQEKKEMKDHILNQKTIRFKLAFIPTIFIVLLLVSGVIGVTANTIVKHHKTTRNSEYLKSVEVIKDKIDVDVNVNSIKDTKYYTRSEIESLFGIKILKNDLIDNDRFQLNTYQENNQKISKIAFDFLDNPRGLNMFFGIRTKYWQDKENDNIMWIAGETKDIEYYYIPALDTEAVIFETKSSGEIDTGFMLVNFIYDNVIYDLNVEKYFWSKEDLYQFLNSFYLDE